MIEKPEVLIKDFLDAELRTGMDYGSVEIEHEVQPAPHEPHKLPIGRCAVYVFSVSTDYGGKCPAGPGRVLKVGKVGPNSNARFQYQHYNPNSARSTLAASITNSRVLWPYLGIEMLTERNVSTWIKRNTDRDNFYLNVVKQPLLAELERYLRALVGPVFEGG